MDCERVIEQDFASRYLNGELTESELADYEQHYFECNRCFEELEACRIVKSEWQVSPDLTMRGPDRAKTHWGWFGVGAIAATVLVGAFMLWRFAGAPGSGLPETGPRKATSRLSPPSRREGGEAGLAKLAEFRPPEYRPLSLRSGSDPASRLFRAGMEHYVEGSYTAALDELQEAARLNSRAPNIAFFLAVTELLAGHPDEAVTGFERTIALGDTPYLEGARFYLAKAYLARRQVGPAVAELEELVALDGDMAGQARELLEEVRALRMKVR